MKTIKFERFKKRCWFAWRLLLFSKWLKKCKNDQITWLYILIKGLNLKISGEKSLHISQQYQFKKKIWNKSQTNFGLKKAYFFWVTLIHSVTLRLCHKIFFCLQNISTRKKNQPFPITTSRDKRGGHNAPILFVCKIPRIPPSFEGTRDLLKIMCIFFSPTREANGSYSIIQIFFFL